MARVLFACDELCGFLTACALVQPGKSLAEVKVPSVRKKLKDKAFAKTVNREDIRQGVEELGVDLDAHIEFVLSALREIAPDLGL
jgi:predicted hydrolase (HD superfamily)